MYKSRATPESKTIQNRFLKQYLFKRLTEDDKRLCEGKITMSELYLVLKNMKNGKSPGTDGFTAEFYKFFWSDMKFLVLNSLNEYFEKDELSVTQKQGIIALLPKGVKPRQYIKNWRPISLRNVNYKLLSGVLASRLKKVLPKIISMEQKGFLENRYIGENIRTLYDIMQYLNEKQKLGMLLQIDFEKAFDSIEWKYINVILERYNLVVIL